MHLDSTRIRRISPSKYQPVWSNAAFGTLFLPLIPLCGRRYSRRHVLSSCVWPPSAARLRTRLRPLSSYKKITLGACKYETVVRNKQPSGLPVRGGLPMTSFVAIRQLPVRHFEEYHFFYITFVFMEQKFFTARAAIFNTSI